MTIPTGKQWIRLYRGLAGVNPEEVNKKELGIHWTPDVNVAYNFATSRDISGTPYWDDDEIDDSPRGTIVEALIHRRHIIDPESDEGWSFIAGGDIFSPSHPEQERTVRPQGTVHIQKMHDIDESWGDAPEAIETTVVPRNLRSRGRA